MTEQSKDGKQKEPTLKCPLSKEQQDLVIEITDTFEKHKNLIKKVLP
ncbi:MAG TPA: hypothetical protein V6D37_10040 [Candidatus Sericytochromatia bacterium]|jgi:hypothetical protein